ncbi:MAG: class I SAM-dependent methyltransferase [Chthoniobacterales bacterium]
MNNSFQHVRDTWRTLGETDPLWAILSQPGKEGGAWNVAEFLATGDAVVDQYRRLFEVHNAPISFGRVLDFGCGVGRLSLAWSKHAGEVIGIDVSAPMIERGRSIVARVENVRLALNEKPDLRQFPDDSFDLIFSHIVLQHIPWENASAYLLEFARVCRVGGWVAFQLPSRAGGDRLSKVRGWLVDNLPFGLAKVYRRWRRGVPVAFDMHFTSPETVISLLGSAGMRFVHCELDLAAGENTTGFIYLWQKTAASRTGPSASA